MALEQPGQVISQECWGSAQRWLTSISVATTLEQPGQRGLRECWGSAPRWPTHLDLFNNRNGATGAERFAGVLGQCRALNSLNLANHEIGETGAESLAGALGQCAALTHLVLGGNRIGAKGAWMLRATWRGAVSGLRFCLKLTIKGQDSSLLLVFLVDKTALLQELMGAYCLHEGLEMNRICFLFAGNRLRETQKPAQLNMEDDDVIDA